jgi:hypothetical protein
MEVHQMGKKSIGSKSLSVNKLPAKTAQNPIGVDRQLLFIEVEKETDGVGMGVLSDGTAFLTGRGLARLCDISNARIVEMGQAWGSESKNPMAQAVKAILRERGILPESPFMEINRPGGAFYAYPDVVCLAVLEYQAVGLGNAFAMKNFRLLAGTALRNFVYEEVGYNPNARVLDAWRQFHDRYSLTYNAVPPGYFCIFKEIADVIVHLGQMGLMIDSTFVPDISVGKCWSAHWRDNSFDEKFGPRIRYEHNYPEYMPQAASNPQEPFCYPDAALGEFRRWMREHYIGGGKFKKYLDGQVAKRALPPTFAQLAIAAYASDGTPAKQLPPR